MQKFNKPCIKTGNFAKLCNTNKRTLIHYDQIGLLCPAYTDEKGYRYYTEGQSDIFFMITCLKDLGMPLKEIKTYVDRRNPQVLHSLLTEEKRKIEGEIRHFRRLNQVVKTKLYLIEQGSQVTFQGRVSKVYMESMPEEYLLLSPRLDTSDHEILINALCDHIGACNRQNLNTGNPYGAMIAFEELKTREEDRYAYFMTKISADSDEIMHIEKQSEHGRLENLSFMKKPAGNYVSVFLKGDYYDANEAYEKLLQFCKNHNFSPDGYCYKEAIWDELTVSGEEEYITKLSIQLNEG